MLQENVLTESFRSFGTILGVKVVKEKGGLQFYQWLQPTLLFLPL